MQKCKICGEGLLTEKVGFNKVLDVEFHYSTCSSCGSDQASSEQARRNKEIALDKYKSIAE